MTTPPAPRLLLAPMEGLLDADLRDTLTAVGGVERCVSEFIRVTDQLLPARVFLRQMPELRHGSRTPSGTPVRAQLLGSEPSVLADNAARLAELGAEGIDRSMASSVQLNEKGMRDSTASMSRKLKAMRAIHRTLEEEADFTKSMSEIVSEEEAKED